MTDTVAARLTPSGTGAIAVLGLAGPRAWEIARPLFRPRGKKVPERSGEASPGDFWLGHFGEEIVDEVVFAVKRVEPETHLEIHCHGGREVVRLLLELVEQRGAKVVDWQTWLRRFASPLQAEAEIALAHAKTERTSAILLDQYHGALSDALSEALALLEKDDQASARRLLEQMENWSSLGSHLTHPWRIVIAGPPNVGKSSLINALAGYQRAIVSETPGTTRDVVRVTLAIDGWLVEFADTAGQREQAERLEAEGIELARRTMAEADLCLWMVDASAEPQWPPEPWREAQVIINKIDLPPAWDLSRAEGAWRVSARTGEGLPGLCERLSHSLVPEVPRQGQAVPFAPELGEWVRGILKAIERGQCQQATADIQALLSRHC